MLSGSQVIVLDVECRTKLADNLARRWYLKVKAEEAAKVAGKYRLGVTGGLLVIHMPVAAVTGAGP